MKHFLFLCLISVSGLSSDCMLVENNDEEENFQAKLLHELAERSHPQGKLERVIKLRVAKEKSIDLKNAHGETPFITALRVGNAHAAHLFFHGGCDYNATDRDGKTTINLACQAGDVNTVKELLAKNVQLDQRNKDGDTPLHSVSLSSEWLTQGYSALELCAYQALCADMILGKATRLGKKRDLLAQPDAYKRTPADRACWSNVCALSVFVKHGAVIHPIWVPIMADTHLKCLRLLRSEIAQNKQQENHAEEVLVENFNKTI